MSTMTIKKTSIGIEETIWKKWLNFAIQRTGSARKIGEITGKALEEYIENHKNDPTL